MAQLTYRYTHLHRKFKYIYYIKALSPKIKEVNNIQLNTGYCSITWSKITAKHHGITVNMHPKINQITGEKNQTYHMGSRPEVKGK